LELIDSHQIDMFASIRACDGNAQCVERATAIDSTLRVESDETLKGGNLQGKFTSEPSQIIIVPLRRRFPGNHRSDSFDPISVRWGTIVG